MPKITFRTKMAGVWAGEHSPKFWDPLLIFATILARDFKFGI